MRMQLATIPTSSSSILSSASHERRQFRNKLAVDDYYPPLELPLRWRDPPQFQHSNRALPPPQTTATESRLTQLQSLSPMDAAKQGHSISSNHNSTFRSTSCFSSLHLDFALVPTARAEPKLAANFNSTVNPKECTQSDGMQESDRSSAEEDSNLGAQHSDMVVLDAKTSSDVQVISAQICISSPTMSCGDAASTVPLQPLVQEVLDCGLAEAAEALAVQTAKRIDQHMIDHGNGEIELNDNYNVGIGNDFIVGVEMPGLNSAEKVDPTPCPQTTRCYVANDFRTHIPTFSLPPHHHVFPASLTVLQPNHEFFIYVGISTDIQFGRLLLVVDTNFCIDDADKFPELARNIRRVDATNFNDHLLERGFMGNSYGDSLSIQKAYIGALLQQQKQFGMPFLGKSSFYNNPFLSWYVISGMSFGKPCSPSFSCWIR